MLFSAVSVVALASVGALAAPLAPRADDIDTTILQYALTLAPRERILQRSSLQVQRSCFRLGWLPVVGQEKNRSDWAARGSARSVSLGSSRRLGYQALRVQVPLHGRCWIPGAFVCHRGCWSDCLPRSCQQDYEPCILDRRRFDSHHRG